MTGPARVYVDGETTVAARDANDQRRIAELELSVNRNPDTRFFKRIVLAGGPDQEHLVIQHTGPQGYMSFRTEDGASRYGYLTSRANGTMQLQNEGGGSLVIGTTSQMQLLPETNLRVAGSSPMVVENASTESIRLIGGPADNAYISFYNQAGSARRGYLQHSGAMNLVSESGGILIKTDGGTVVVDSDTGDTFMRPNRYVVFGSDKTGGNQIANRGVEVDTLVGRMWVTHDNAGNVANIALNRVNAAAINSGSPFVQFNRAGTAIGTITVRSDNAGVNYNVTSDGRLKEVLGHMTGCLARVRAIAIERYRWKASGVEAYGPIAQALHKVLPHAVTVGGEDPAVEPWMADMGATVPDLIGAVQELADAIDALREAVNA